MLTKTELNRLATLMAKASNEDMKAIRDMFNSTMSSKQKEAANKFTAGDMVVFTNSRTGKVVKGQVTKVNRKTIAVKSGITNWKVSPSMLRFQY